MVDSSIIRYLNGIINCKESINDLLKIIAEISGFNTCEIFLHSEKYICIEHYDVVENEDFVSIDKEHIFFVFEKNIKDIEHSLYIPNNQVSKNTYTSYKSPYTKANNILITPINIGDTSNMGILCLINNHKDLDIVEVKNIVKKITAYISILQLILQKDYIISQTSAENSHSSDHFIANISHEIRTPLNGIIGYSQLLTQTNLTQVQKEYLYSMNKCSIQLMQIISDILDFSKLSCGKMKINNEYFHIQEVIEQVKDVTNQQIIEKKQNITYNIDSNIHNYIIADKQKLTQILINLISNSCKFTNIYGFIQVSIKSKSITKLNKDELEIMVKDNGIGIKKEDQVNLFNSFVQINNLNCKTGSGLGLFICKKLVELLDGSIKLESEFGMGTTVFFNIKFEMQEDFDKYIKKDIKLLKDKYILVVDDNADNRILISEILFSWKMKPIICASAIEALTLISANRYKFFLALIDICMPGTSGVDLAKKIKDEKPFLPLVALSSIDSFINYHDFDKKIDKPINKIQLFNIIYSIILKKKTELETSDKFSDSSSTTNEDSDSGSDIYYSPKISKDTTIDIKILIIEDVDYNRNLLVNMLENISFTLGKNISIAENGEEAIKLFTEGNYYNIILLDLIMPVVDGFEVREYIREAKIKSNIIVTTASVVEETKTKCRKLGIKNFLEKPIDFKKFKKVILKMAS